jgi:phage shock protein PspC (stress-responsive transcriptional regulator)
MVADRRLGDDGDMHHEATGQPPYSEPAAPPPPTPPGPPARKLRRSRTNRRVAGVAGGLGDYLGIDANVLRLGFVLFSIFIGGGVGGPVLYALAWLLVPEEGDDTALWRRAHISGQWHEWDQGARSWALVLGVLALGSMWWFGFWPTWHWQALSVWLVLTGIALWALVHSRTAPSPAPAGAPTPAGDGGSGPGGPPPGWASGSSPSEASPGPGGFAGQSSPPAENGPGSSDWAQAQSAATAWARAQLAAAGVPARERPPSTRPQRCSGRYPVEVVAVVVAVVVGLGVLGGGITGVAHNLTNLLRPGSSLPNHITTGLTSTVAAQSVDLQTEGVDVNLSPGGATRVVLAANVSYSGGRPRLSSDLRSSGVLDLGLDCPGRCGGDLTATVPAGEPVEASSQTGNLGAVGLTGPLQMRSAAGDIQGTSLSGPLQLTSTTGDIAASQLSSATVQVKDQTGDVTLSFTRVPTRVAVSDQSGDITVRVPPGVTYNVEASSQGGSLAVDVRDSGSSPHVLILHDQAGDIAVETVPAGSHGGRS